jgi:hypothetical protein
MKANDRELPRNFPHLPPDNYSYEVEDYNTRVVRIVLHHHCKYDYNLGKPVKTVWGFYSPKKQLYYAPINPTRVGDVVNIQKTTPYTAMPILCEYT